MNIYLAGSLSGGRKFESGIKAIADILETKEHEILTPFVVDETLNRERFPNLSSQERANAIMQEDIDLLLQSDAVIAKVSQPSTGVGIELGVALGMKLFTGTLKPTLCLRHMSLFNERNSALIEGNKHTNFKYYDEVSANDLEEKIVSFLKNVEFMEGQIKKERE